MYVTNNSRDGNGAGMPSSNPPFPHFERSKVKANSSLFLTFPTHPNPAPFDQTTLLLQYPSFASHDLATTTLRVVSSGLATAWYDMFATIFFQGFKNYGKFRAQKLNPFEKRGSLRIIGSTPARPFTPKNIVTIILYHIVASVGCLKFVLYYCSKPVSYNPTLHQGFMMQNLDTIAWSNEAGLGGFETGTG